MKGLTMKGLTRFFTFAFVVSCLCISVFAQVQNKSKNTRDRAVVDQFIQEVLTNAAEMRGEQEAKVRLSTKAEIEVMDELSKKSAAKEKAVADLGIAKAEVARTRSGIKHGGAQAIGGLEAYESSVKNKAAVEAEALELGRQEQAARLGLEKQQAAKLRARLEMTQIETRLTEQKNEIEDLYGKWINNKTEESFKALTGFLTYLSNEYNLDSDVEFSTEDSLKHQTGGARVSYESELDRKNNAPVKSTKCTTVKPPDAPPCVEQGMRTGWYYIWSVRDGGKVTSDKAFYTHIGRPTAKITVQEHN